MVAELISVGTEILLGNITNTNARYLAEQCASLGLSCYYQVTVGDNPDRLEGALKQALKRSDVVILTGGLGPTNDDLTKEIAAKVLEKPLAEDLHTRECIKTYFKNSMHRVVTENNWKQALVPQGAKVIDNHNGTAPGLIMETRDQKCVILLPGPPNELYPMFEQDIRPYLSSLTKEIIYSRTVKIGGLGESFVATEIKDLLDAQTNPTIAPYAKTGEVHLRVTARARTTEDAKKMIRPVLKELKHRFGINIFATHEEVSMEDKLVSMLQKRGWTITTAESCTGGLLSGRLINVAGASNVIDQCFVTYANAAKHALLGVKNHTLKKHGAVSPQTAREMAKGAAKAAGADVAISVTGIAGPGGGTKEKPVGLVYIGCYVKGYIEVMECHFSGNRSKVREATVARAIDFARRCVIRYSK